MSPTVSPASTTCFKASPDPTRSLLPGLIRSGSAGPFMSISDSKSRLNASAMLRKVSPSRTVYAPGAFSAALGAASVT